MGSLAVALTIPTGLLPLLRKVAMRRIATGFSLLELLMVLAVIGLMLAIVLPVLAQARAKQRQATCLSNERQLGAALIMYLSDSDDSFPNGINWYRGGASEIASSPTGPYNNPVNPIDNNSASTPESGSKFSQAESGALWPGEGWAGQCYPYIHNQAVFTCPGDTSLDNALSGELSLSYAYNIDLVDSKVHTAPTHLDPTLQPSGHQLSELTAPSRTIALFEVSHVWVNLNEERYLAAKVNKELPPTAEEEAIGVGRNLSASSNGLDNRLYAQKRWATSIQNRYATGLLAGRQPYDPQATQFVERYGRHQYGSNYLLADGHVVWLRGERVSAGINAVAAHCHQDNEPPLAGCDGVHTNLRAAGTASDEPLTATFSIR
jgi:prepilin-type N-terminal cleavage/methylation domain-containing protein/prepilin-type processing-associated H-X9-DG protein